MELPLSDDDLADYQAGCETDFVWGLLRGAITLLAEVADGRSAALAASPQALEETLTALAARRMQQMLAAPDPEAPPGVPATERAEVYRRVEALFLALVRQAVAPADRPMQ